MDPLLRNVRSRQQLSLPVAFAAVAAAIGVALFASATPSPLYGVYQARWHFSTLVLTLVYGVYAIGVLSSLVLVGGLSDQTGRRPVLVGALLALLVSMGVFVAADSVAWLFVARAIQGLATGALLGAAGAALIDLHPRGDTRQAALVNGFASTAGIGGGALVSSAMVRFLPAQRVIPFVLVAMLIVALLWALRVLPEPVARTTRVRLRPQSPSVPAATRGAFLLAALGVLASWSIGGLYLALGPALAGALLHTHSELAGGAAVAALSLPAGLAQLAGRGLSNRALTAGGALLLALGMSLTAAALSGGSALLFLLATAVAGVGFGLAFMGALRHLTSAIPDGRRGGVMSAFYVVAYLAISLPAVAAGLAAPGLGLVDTFQVFSLGVVVLALLVAAGGLRIEASVSSAASVSPT
ncbi:MAG: MFS transporter [Solirubrobacteraceae bacterium]|jgi:MFS family permease